MAIPNSYDILQAVIEATPDEIFVKDLDGRYVLVNEAFARFIGKTSAEIVGRNDFELYPEKDARSFVEADRQVLASGQPMAFEGVATGQAGERKYLVTKGVYRDKDGQILGVYGISHDITELQQAHESLEQTREALFRSQKMEAVGQLTGGIAHDFNNILAIILGNVELLRLHFPSDSHAGEIIDAVMRATLHGKDLTGHLLAFSRRRLLNPQAVEINTLVASVVRLLGRTLGANIRVVTETSRGAGIAFADPAALEAAILNIALNARDAMPDGGAIDLEVRRLADPADARKIEIRIHDHGPGIPPQILERVFDPLFTTKPSGAGLGLSIAHQAMQQQDGRLRALSTPGEGTTFSMLFREGTRPTPATELSQHPHPGVALKRVVVVEDDEAVGEGIRALLADEGFDVDLVARGGLAEDAVTRFSPDVVLLDVNLPDMSGIDVYENLHRRWPRLPVIFSTGHADARALEDVRSRPAPSIMKPYDIQELIAVFAALPVGA